MGRRRHSLQALQEQMRARHPQGARGRGRPALAIDPETVIALASEGRSAADIASFLNCDPKTIRQRFPRELDMGKARYSSLLKLVDFETGVGKGDVRTVIRQVKMRSGGWQEPSSLSKPITAQQQRKDARGVQPPAPAAERQAEAKTATKVAKGWWIREFEM